MKKTQFRFEKYMIRPTVYMTFCRGLLALTALLLADFFVSDRDIRSGCFLIGAIMFLLLAWIALLRLDGVKLPKVMMMRVNPRKKPARMLYGDIADHLDDRPAVDFDDLDEREKDLCILIADAVCAVAFGITAAVLA